MTDLEFLILLSLRRTPQRRSHFWKLGEAYAQAADALRRRGLIEDTTSRNFGDAYKLTDHGRRQAHTEWIHRGKPTLEQLLAKLSAQAEGENRDG